jgi:ABC-type ATPase with predicted acetyltransferase domain
MDRREKILKVNNIKKFFGGIMAITDVSFNIEKGTISAVIGPNGAGKTTLINQQLKKLRDDKVIVMGYKGDFLTKFYYPQDIIFNLFDERNIGWRVLNDLKKKPQIESFAKTMIQETKETFWSDSARLVFTAICEIAISIGKTSNKDIFNYLSLPLPEMYSLLKKASSNIESCQNALQALGGSDTKQGKSILSNLSHAIKDFKYLNDGNFSFRKWVQNNNINWSHPKIQSINSITI